MKTALRSRLTFGVAFCGTFLFISAAALGETPPETLPDTPSDQKDIIGLAIKTYQEAQSITEPAKKVDRFRQARQLYQQAIDAEDHPSATLYMDHGHAAMQSRALGHAILSYRRALAIDPGLDQAEQNLIAARKRLPSWVPVPESNLDQLASLHKVSPAFISVISGTLILTGMLLIALSLRYKLPVARHIAILLFIVWSVFTGIRMIESSNTDELEAVILTEAILRSADAFGATPKLNQPLPAGTEVSILESREGWRLIRLQDGRDGWIKSSQLNSI